LPQAIVSGDGFAADSGFSLYAPVCPAEFKKRLVVALAFSSSSAPISSVVETTEDTGKPLPELAGFQAFGCGRFWVFANTLQLHQAPQGIETRT